MGEVLLMQQPIRLDQLMQELLEHLETTHHEAAPNEAAFLMPKETP